MLLYSMTNFFTSEDWQWIKTGWCHWVTLLAG